MGDARAGIPAGLKNGTIKTTMRASDYTEDSRIAFRRCMELNNGHDGCWDVLVPMELEDYESANTDASAAEG